MEQSLDFGRPQPVTIKWNNREYVIGPKSRSGKVVAAVRAAIEKQRNEYLRAQLEAASVLAKANDEVQAELVIRAATTRVSKPFNGTTFSEAMYDPTLLAHNISIGSEGSISYDDALELCEGYWSYPDLVNACYTASSVKNSSAPNAGKSESRNQQARGDENAGE